MRFRIQALLLIAALGLASGVNAQTLKIATLAPEGSQWVKDMRAGAAEIATRTDGRVKLKLYAGGVKGNDNKVLRKIRIRELHGAYLTATSLQDRYPDINIFGMPFMYESEEEVRFVRAKIEPTIRAGLLEAGFETFGFAGGGFARLMSGKPVQTLADLSREKVWVPEGDPISYEAMLAMDLSPVTLPVTDVLTGLQSGLVDIVGSPPVAALVLQWHTKVKYITDLPLVYTIGYLALDKRAFGKLSAADQVVVREVLEGVNSVIDEANVVDNQKALEALQNAGLKFVVPDVNAANQWRDRVMEANRAMAKKGLVSEDLFSEVETILAEYRSASAVANAQ